MKALLACLCLSLAPAVASAGGLQRVKYNNPGLVVDLAVGLWAWPLPMDFNGDGNLDLVVSCPDKPFNGLYFFENAAGDTAKTPLPIFRPGRRIIAGCKRRRCPTSTAARTCSHRRSSIPSFSPRAWKKASHCLCRATCIRSRFAATSGAMSTTTATASWTSSSAPTTGPITAGTTPTTPRAVGPTARCAGSSTCSAISARMQAPKYDKPVKVMAGDKPVEIFGWPSPNFADFRGTGKLDLIAASFSTDSPGSRISARGPSRDYAPGRRLKTLDGKPLAMDLEMITPVAIDWNKDGPRRLICGDEDGRVALLENTGQADPDGTPQFLPPRVFPAAGGRPEMRRPGHAGGLRLGRRRPQDIICGNSAGYIWVHREPQRAGVEPEVGRAAISRSRRPGDSHHGRPQRQHPGPVPRPNGVTPR